MLKRLIIASLVILCGGCASQPIAEPKTNVEAPATTWKVVSSEKYSFSVPSTFIDTKKPTESLIDKSYTSPDHFLVITTATDKSTYPIEFYAMGLAQVMVDAGNDLIEHRAGRWGGMNAQLIVLGVQHRALVLHFLAKDRKDNVYMMACAINPLMLKTYGPLCGEISRTFVLLPETIK